MHSMSVIIRQIHCSVTVGIYSDMIEQQTTRFHLDWLLPFTLQEEIIHWNSNVFDILLMANLLNLTSAYL